MSHQNHAFQNYFPQTPEGLTVRSRRNMLKAGLAGVAGLSLPDLLRARAEGASGGKPVSNRSVILLWMTGGPSQIDTWDPKPDRPWINRGPFAPISTALPGVTVCEHLPKQAAMLDRFTVIRSVDPKNSNHQPNQVMQGRGQCLPAMIDIGAESIPIGEDDSDSPAGMGEAMQQAMGG